MPSGYPNCKKGAGNPWGYTGKPWRFPVPMPDYELRGWVRQALKGQFIKVADAHFNTYPRSVQTYLLDAEDEGLISLSIKADKTHIIRTDKDVRL